MAASAGPVPTLSEGAFGLALSLTQTKQNPTIMKLDCAEISLPDSFPDRPVYAVYAMSSLDH